MYFICAACEDEKKKCTIYITFWRHFSFVRIVLINFFSLFNCPSFVRLTVSPYKKMDTLSNKLELEFF